MRNANRFGLLFAAFRVVGKTLLASLALAWVCVAQQGQPALQITSPTAGTIFNPGQTITVSVSSPANVSFSQLGVIGEDPIGTSSIASSAPAQFSMTIPTDIACRTFMLTAVGATSSGQFVQSATILIDVERPDPPVSLSTLMSGITFETLGEQSPVTVLATFSDGSILDATRSSYVVYSSANPAIAAVDANGIVTGVSAGGTTITATYTLNGQTVNVNVPVTVPPPVLSPSPGSLAFNSQNVGTSSASESVTLTNLSNAPLKVLTISAAGDFSETDNCVTSSPLAANATCIVNVTFAPTAAGNRMGTLRIANSFNNVVMGISLAGTGIGQPTTVTSVASSANPAVFGQTVTLTATVSPTSGSGTPTGTVTFSDGSTTLASESLTNGQATFTTSSFSVGSHPITAAYGGDGTFQSSIATLTEIVNPASTTTTVSSSSNPSILNSSVTLTATVNVVAPGAGTPTGSIAFKDGSTVLATVAINTPGQATFSTSSLAAGSHSMTAAYSGDSNFNGSASAVLKQLVQYEPAGTACDGDAGHQILQPINADGSSVFKQGQTVPAKFRVCDANGNSISSAGVVAGFLLTQTISGTVTTTVEDIVNTNNPDSAFRWDATDQQWIFNISTQNLAANSTYVYTIALNDGTVINFQFGLH